MVVYTAVYIGLHGRVCTRPLYVHGPCTRQTMYTARVHGRVQAVYTAVYTDHVQVYTARTRTVHGRIRGRVDGRVRAA